MFDKHLADFNKKKPQERAAMLGIGTVGLVVLAVLGLYLFNPPDKLDEFGCPSAGPVENRIFVIDRTDVIPKSAQRSIRMNIEKIVNEAPQGTRFSVFEIDADYMNGLSGAKFSMCKMRDGSQANPYNENPDLLRKKYEKDFLGPLMFALDSVLIGEAQDRTPIMEALVDMTSVEAFQVPAPTTVYLFSDLLQHTEIYSHYRDTHNFRAAAALPLVKKMVPSMGGARVHLYFMLRGGKTLKLQTNDLIAFWVDYLETAHAEVQRIKKIR